VTTQSGDTNRPEYKFIDSRELAARWAVPETELIDSAQLAARLRVPESWVRNHTRGRTPRAERIPCLRLGKYVRFEWGSPRLTEWLEKKRQ
jgi:hypothetical protein